MGPLFARRNRSDPSVRRAAESTYRFLDRIDDPAIDRVRALLNEWTERFEATQPAAAVNDLLGRLRSKQDSQFYTAFWELYLHEITRGSALRSMCTRSPRETVGLTSHLSAPDNASTSRL